MANQETQMLDEIVVTNRRKMLTLGASSLAAIVLGASSTKAKAATTYSDADILNFALNLEYLEASFYYQAAFGTNINVANDLSTTAGAPLIKLTGTVGVQGAVTGGSKVPFATTAVGSYAVETAVEEGKHVQFLLGALGGSAVAFPSINIGTAFQGLATAAGISGSFSPYTSDATFLIGAYVFEDVGVTAYHGAAPLITTPAYLTAAAGILAVEAYHAGLVRTTINVLDPDGSLGYVDITNKISTLRATLAQQALLGVAAGPFDGNPDDYGLSPFTVTVGGNAGATATRTADADPTNVIAFARNTTQILNIVTGGGAVTGTTVITPATGVFFPNGLNAGPNGFK